MSTITLPNIRVGSDLQVRVRLKDGGVAIDWSTLQNIKACIYSDAQRALAGRCGFSIDEEDSTLLVCTYAANKPQYLGVNRIVISAKYMGETKTYDKPAFTFVRWTADQEGEEITIDDPDVDVEIEVEDVSSSLLDQAIAAALVAAAAAEHAAHLIPNQVLLDAEAATVAANAAADAANAAGITSAQVSIADNEPGTPSAEVSLANKVLSIIFHHLKGNTGDAAGFGSITATVDDVVGDPSVTVTVSGPDTAKNFTFAFHGLRGIQGVPGVANAKYKSVDTLPTASAATMDFIYLTPSGTTGVYNMSYTEQDGSTYSWQDLGTTAIQLSDYATKAEVSQLEAKVDGNPGSTVEVQVNTGDYTRTSHTITAQNKWTGTTTGKSILLPVSSGQIIRFVTHLNTPICALLKDDFYQQDYTPHFCTGYESRFTPTDRETITIPTDCNYVYILVKNSTGDTDADIYLKTITPGVVGLIDRMNDAEDEITAINEELEGTDYTRTPIDISGYTSYRLFIISSGYWAGTGNFTCILIPVSPGDKLEFITGTNPGNIALLKSDARVPSTRADFCDDYQSRFIPRNGEIIVMPSDANYLYYTILAGGQSVDTTVNELTGTKAAGLSERIELLEHGVSEIAGDTAPVPEESLTKSVGNTLRPLEYDLDGNDYEKPDTHQRLDVQKKSKQMTSIEWTPKSAVPNNSGSFPANTPVTGLPYSSVKECDKFVGEQVSIHTFMTAVNNPYSLLYTENVSADNSASAWGKTYHGNNCASYYGVVCTTLTSLCVGYSIDYASFVHEWMCKKAYKMVRLFDQHPDNFAIGDIMWKVGHCRLIYGIKRDSDGNATILQVSEAAGTRCKQQAMTVDTFLSLIESENGIMYRPLELYKNKYNPSDFVAVGDESITPFVYNNDICCFAGDKATFREGDTIAVNYNLVSVGSWTGMELYKGDTLLDTIAIDSSVHTVDLTSRNLTYGKYKARMTDGVNYSDFTEWEILKADVSCTVINGFADISFDSTGVAKQVKICDESGTAFAFRELSDEETETGKLHTDLYTLAEEQTGTLIKGLSGVYLKVYFEGDFGQITNVPLAVQF